MRITRIFAILFCIIFLNFGLKAESPGLKSYSYPSEGFRVSFPGSPTINKNSIKTESGTYELRSYLCTTSSAAYFVGVCDYGKNGAWANPDDQLQGAKNGALKNSKSHLIKEQKIKLSVVPGLEFDAENDENHFKARIYIAGTTLYQVLIVSPVGSSPPDTTDFLDSFGLITRTEP